VLSLFELPTDEIKAALAELIIIRLHGYLVRGAQPRRLTRLLVLDEAWRVASSKHLENLAREGRAFGVGLAIGTQYPGDLPPDLAGSLATKIFLKNQQPDHRKTVVRALTGGSSAGAQATELLEFMEKQEMFQSLIQNQQYAPFAAFKLVPYYAREQVEEHPGGTGTLGR
jgi:DNA helicase HerA-like ATPase